MKISTIKKNLIKQSAIVVVIVGLAGGILWFLDSLDGECDMDINRLKAQTNDLSNQVLNLTTEYSKVESYADIYKEIEKNQRDKKLTVDKTILRNVIAGARNKYYLDSLDVKMGEIKPYDGDKYKRESVFIESSDVTINLNTLSDLDIFGLVRALETSFSGVKFTSFNMSSVKNLDNAALITIKDSGFTPIVSGKIAFKLFGLHNIKKAEKELLSDDANSQVGVGR
jgi:hypothetical protein